MFGSHSIKSGDHCANFQVGKLDYIQGLSPNELNKLRDWIALAIQAQARKDREFERLGTAAPNDNDISLFDRADPLIDPQELVSIIESWSPNQDHATKQLVLQRFFFEGVGTIFSSPKLATYILDNLACDPLIESITVPACKLSIESKVDLDDLRKLLDALSSFQMLDSTNCSNPLQIYLIQVLFSILYRSRTREEDEELAHILRGAALQELPLIGQFYVDVYYRIELNYLHATDALKSLVDCNANEYFSRYHNYPLTQIKNALTNPIAIYGQHKLEVVQEDLSKLARVCQNVIEARWVISTFFRLLPLYKTEDLDIDYDKLIECVTSNFSDKILNNCHFLLYANLRAKLYIFYMTGNISYLEDYEKQYVAKKKALTWYQQIALQLEYSASIYMYLLNNDMEALSGTKFFSLAEKGGDDLIQSIMFSNVFVIVDARLRVFKGGDRKGLLLKWLYSYVNKIYVLHSKKQLEINPFQLFNYRATSKVPLLRAKIIGLITKFVNEEESAGHITISPSYANKILSLIEFSRASKAFDCKIMEAWIDSALQSSKYNILMSAKALSYAMYAVKYYCGNDSPDQVARFLNKFKTATGFYGIVPRLYMATAECLTLSNEKLELLFIVDLHASLTKVNRKVFQLALRKEEVYNLIIPDEMVRVINDYEKQGSVIARVGKYYMLNTEYWNLLATTIFNLNYPDLPQSLDIASMFYSVAKCFAREQRNIDHKYSYNYIRSRSLYYINTNTSPPNGFIRDCSFYIDRPNNQYFTFKKSCCRPFFELIKLYYDGLSEDIKKLYRDQILSNHQWIKKAFFDLKIGEFSEEIRIK